MAGTPTFFFFSPFFFLPFNAYFIICSVSSASIFVSSVVSSLVSSPASTTATGVRSAVVEGSNSAEKLITYPSAPLTLISMSGSAAAILGFLVSFFFFFAGASGSSAIIYSNEIPSFLHRSRSYWYFLNPLMTLEVFELWARSMFM